MTARKYVYRLVVDKWPTADGKPFVDQPLDWWEQVVDYFHNPVGENPTPEWLPDISPYLDDPGDCWTSANWYNTPRFTRILGDPGEPQERDYPGSPGYNVIAVPIAPTRRFMQKSTPVKIAEQLRQWGCVVHVERAELGEWEAVA